MTAPAKASATVPARGLPHDLRSYKAPLSAHIREFCRIHDRKLYALAWALLIAFMMFLSGCMMAENLREHEEMHCAGYTHPPYRAGTVSLPQWTHSRPPAKQPWLYLYVARPDDLCRFLGSDASSNAVVNGCAVWEPEGCTIILPIYLKPKE